MPSCLASSLRASSSGSPRGPCAAGASTTSARGRTEQCRGRIASSHSASACLRSQADAPRAPTRPLELRQRRPLSRRGDALRPFFGPAHAADMRATPRASANGIATIHESTRCVNCFLRQSVLHRHAVANGRETHCVGQRMLHPSDGVRLVVGVIPILLLALLLVLAL